MHSKANIVWDLFIKAYKGGDMYDAMESRCMMEV